MKQTATDTVLQLQLIQDTAAGLITRTMSTLLLLLILYTGYSIDHKVLLLVYKSLSDVEPEYISDLPEGYKRPVKLLLGSSQLVEPQVRTKPGEAAFRY